MQIYYKFQQKLIIIENFFFDLMQDWISGKWLKTSSIDHQPLISSSFIVYQSNNDGQNSIATLFQDCIIIEHKITHSKLRIAFQKNLLLQVNRFKRDNNSLGQARSLKFIFNQNSLELKNSNIPEEIEIWIQKLSEKLHKTGFHEHFQAIKKIGKGGFASVYLVKNRKNSQEIAVKAFSKQAIAAEKRGQQSLQNEIKILRLLKHKNLMRLHQVFETKSSYYLCVQLLSGGSLCQRIKQQKSIEPNSIKNILRCILQGLQYLHKNQVMHRDLKPDNILFRRKDNDQCVIADFGLSQLCYEQDTIFRRCGTPGYVAPQVINMKSQDPMYNQACDLFSVGVILHILALHKVPFQGSSYESILAKNRKGDIDFSDATYSAIPSSWLNLLMQLMEKDPKKRIKASQALNHQFFSQDENFKQFTLERQQTNKQNNFASFNKYSILKQKKDKALQKIPITYQGLSINSKLQKSKQSTKQNKFPLIKMKDQQVILDKKQTNEIHQDQASRSTFFKSFLKVGLNESQVRHRA